MYPLLYVIFIIYITIRYTHCSALHCFLLLHLWPDVKLHFVVSVLSVLSTMTINLNLIQQPPQIHKFPPSSHWWYFRLNYGSGWNVDISLNWEPYLQIQFPLLQWQSGPTHNNPPTNRHLPPSLSNGILNVLHSGQQLTPRSKRPNKRSPLGLKL